MRTRCLAGRLGGCDRHRRTHLGRGHTTRRSSPPGRVGLPVTQGWASGRSARWDHPFALQARGDWQSCSTSLGRARLSLSSGRRPGRQLRSGRAAGGLADLGWARRNPAGTPGQEPNCGSSVCRTYPEARWRTPAENPAGLTERQLEVLRLLARGLTNNEIASQLVLSVRTVDRHVAEILAKLGVTSRRQAAARAEALGISRPGP